MLTWYSVRATPEVASAPVSVSVTGPVPSVAAVVDGAVASTLTVTDFADSALPALSVERYSTVCVPSPPTLNGALYAANAPPSTRCSVRSTPDTHSPSSPAASVTCAPVRYQPLAPSGAAGASVCEVDGAARSTALSGVIRM